MAVQATVVTGAEGAAANRRESANTKTLEWLIHTYREKPATDREKPTTEREGPAEDQ